MQCQSTASRFILKCHSTPCSLSHSGSLGTFNMTVSVLILNESGQWQVLIALLLAYWTPLHAPILIIRRFNNSWKHLKINAIPFFTNSSIDHRCAKFKQPPMHWPHMSPATQPLSHDRLLPPESSNASLVSSSSNPNQVSQVPADPSSAWSFVLIWVPRIS